MLLRGDQADIFTFRHSLAIYTVTSRGQVEMKTR